MTIVRALSFGSPISLEAKNGSIPSVMRSIFLSNKASLLAVAAETLLLIVELDATIVGEAETEEVLLCPFFLHLFLLLTI